jgi:hemolysin III
MEPTLREQFVKPLLRGHLHQGAFFFALGACAMLLVISPNTESFIACLVYSISQASLFGISALYHRPNWGSVGRTRMRRLDHAAIFVSIAGTFTPICMLAIQNVGGMKLLVIVWMAAAAGIMQSLFWVKGPKCLSALLYVVMGWLALPYLSEINAALGTVSTGLLIAGGVIYTIGAVIYATKRPNPLPAYFGYHEIFHLLVIIAAICHFSVITRTVLEIPRTSSEAHYTPEASEYFAEALSQE